MTNRLEKTFTWILVVWSGTEGQNRLAGADQKVEEET